MLKALRNHQKHLLASDRYLYCLEKYDTPQALPPKTIIKQYRSRHSLISVDSEAIFCLEMTTTARASNGNFLDLNCSYILIAKNYLLFEGINIDAVFCRNPYGYFNPKARPKLFIVHPLFITKIPVKIFG